MTDGRWHALLRRISFYGPFFSGPVSFFSSLYLIWLVLAKNSKRLRKSPKEHFVVGMAVLDTFGSFGASFSTTPAYDAAPAKSGSFPVYRQYGTIATCEAQGFLVQRGTGVPLYNMALSSYYVLLVIWRVPETRLFRWMVPTVHVVNLSFTLSTAIAALILDLYNPDGVLGCWISKGQKIECGKEELAIFCGRGVDGDLYQLRFMAYHCGLSWAFVLIAMIALYCKVRKTELRSSQWSFRAFMQPRRRQAMPLSRRTMETGILYSLAFLFVFSPIIVTGTPLRKNPLLYNIMIALLACLTPLQGFFNLLIYLSPNWLAKVACSKCCTCCCCWRIENESSRENIAPSVQQPISADDEIPNRTHKETDNATDDIQASGDVSVDTSTQSNDLKLLRQVRNSMFHEAVLSRDVDFYNDDPGDNTRGINRRESLPLRQLTREDDLNSQNGHGQSRRWTIVGNRLPHH